VKKVTAERVQSRRDIVKVTINDVAKKKFRERFPNASTDGRVDMDFENYVRMHDALGATMGSSFETILGLLVYLVDNLTEEDNADIYGELAMASCAIVYGNWDKVYKNMNLKFTVTALPQLRSVFEINGVTNKTLFYFLGHAIAATSQNPLIKRVVEAKGALYGSSAQRAKYLSKGGETKTLGEEHFEVNRSEWTTHGPAIADLLKELDPTQIGITREDAVAATE